jgi:hypothetical protein
MNRSYSKIRHIQEVNQKLEMKLLFEQENNVNYQTGDGSYYGTYGYNKEGKTVWTDLDPHTKNTILSIGTSFIPYIGPFISSGIGMADAKLYYDQGDKKTAGIVGFLSLIPVVVGLGNKLGLGKWSAKMLSELGNKIAKGSKLSPLETKAAQSIAQNEKLIQSEIKNLSNKSGLNPKNNFNYGQKNTAKMGIPSGGISKLIPQEFKSILDKLKPIKVDSNVLNILKSQENGVNLLNGNLKRLARGTSQGGERIKYGTTKIEYNSADVAIDKIIQTMNSANNGGVVDVKSLIENGYKILDDLEQAFKKIPADRGMIEDISGYVHRFMTSLKPLTGYKGVIRSY